MTFPRRPDCPSWCRSGHDGPGADTHYRNLDLVEHLDDSDCMIEINVIERGDDKQVGLLFTDLDGRETQATLSTDAAWILGYIGTKFDRRGAREVSTLLIEACHMLHEGEEMPEDEL